MSRAVCVLGMMRTGTSAVAGLLDLLGVHFGPKDRLLEPNVANPSGFWEHKGVIAAERRAARPARRLLACAACCGSRLAREPDARRSSRAGDRARGRRPRGGRRLGMEGPAHVSDTSVLGRGRSRRLLPVICVREPAATARSFSTMGWAAVDGLERPYETGLDLWLAYTTAAFEGTQGRERVVVFYDDLLDDPDGQSERLAAFAGLSERLTQETPRRDRAHSSGRPACGTARAQTPRTSQNTLHMRNTRGSKATFGGRSQR